MLMPGGLSALAFRFNNFGANPSALVGTSVVPGASNAEGSWTQVAASGDISTDVYALFIHVHNGATSGVDKSHLLDIGVDPAGGTSYTAAISNIVCGLSSGMGTPAAGTGHKFLLPLFIASGSSVAVRVQGAAATAGTVRVAVDFRGKPARPEQLPTGMFSETIGTITNSGGVSFTPGNASDGSWVSLGTTSRAMWWWQLACQISTATTTGAEYTYVELAHGDVTNKHTLIRVMTNTLSTEAMGMVESDNLDPFACYWPLPAGTELWVRGRCNGAPASGYNAVAIGIGG